MSLRAKLAIWQLKRTVKSRPLHEIDPGTLRANMDAMAPKAIPDGVTVEPVHAGAVKGEWHRPREPEAGRIVLYLHGGGYVFGSPKSHRALTFALAQKARATVFSLEYRLAPEHPFPAAIDDAIAAYSWLMAQGVDPDRLVIAGDSAGGGLALALGYAIKARGLKRPAGLLLYSPWTDLTCSGETMETNAKSDAMFKPEYIREGIDRVLQGADPHAPLASPLFADVSGFPAALIFASEDEVLLDDSARMHKALVDAGVESRLLTEKGVPHVWPIFVGKFPEAGKAVAQSVDYIVERTGEAPRQSSPGAKSPDESADDATREETQAAENAA